MESGRQRGISLCYAAQRVKNIDIKVLLKQALTNRINDRALFMKGIDASYYYERYREFKIEEL